MLDLYTCFLARKMHLEKEIDVRVSLGHKLHRYVDWVWEQMMVPFSSVTSYGLLLLICLCSHFQLIECRKQTLYRTNITDQQLYQSTFTPDHLEYLRQETKNLFYYGWDSYMEYGFPFDEVRPLMCIPNKPDFGNYNNKVQNDVLGNFSVTLIDNLDSFIIFEDKNDISQFKKYIDLVLDMYKDFNIDTNVQVFETDIRVLGSLLSAHLYALDKLDKNEYQGGLLKLAYDIGKRLILAFDTDTNIPYPRINLSRGPHGVPKKIQSETCSAGAVSPILELTLLSRLTNDPIFETLTRRTFKFIWNSKSSLDLLPMSIDFKENAFKDTIAGIGASIDSLYEYALKFAILFDDEEFYQIWSDSYTSLLKHSMNSLGVFLNIDINSGMQVVEWIDSLSAFFPGLMVLGGDITNAVEAHKIFWKIWNYYGCIPERWNIAGIRSQNIINRYNSDPDSQGEGKFKYGDTIRGFTHNETNEALVKNSIALEWYPLRPEFIESTYHLYKATRDPVYLQIGQEILYKLQKEFIAPCGFAGVLDVLNDLRQDRMESFVLSETLKYLYLLFDVDNHAINYPHRNIIFSTEGHPLWFDSKMVRDYEFLNEEFGVVATGTDKIIDTQNEMGLNASSNVEAESTDAESSDRGKGGSFMSGFMNLFREGDIERNGLNLDVELHKLRNKVYKYLINYADMVDQLGTEPYLNAFEYGGIEDLAAVPTFHSLQRIRDVIAKLSSFSDQEQFIPNMPLTKSSPKVITPPKVIQHSNSEGSTKIKLSSDYLHLTTCEVPHKQLFPFSFLHSDILNDETFYDIDYSYPLVLRRPMYRIKQLEMELAPCFYDLFTSTDEPMCHVQRDTIEVEGLIEEIAKSTNQTIFEIQNSFDDSSLYTQGDIVMSPGDLYIEDLVGLRMSIELLLPGQRDEFGDIIEEFTDGFTEKFRLLRVNGKKLVKGQTIYINSNNGQFIHGGLKWDPVDRVLIMGDKPVINVKVVDVSSVQMNE